MQAALQRNERAEKDLQAFILNKSPKAISDLIARTWKMQGAPEHCTQISITCNHVVG